MHAIPYILADDFESIGKLIFFGIVILFWLIQKIAKLAGGASTPTPTPRRTIPAARTPHQVPPRPAGPIALPPLKSKAAPAKRTVKKKTTTSVPARAPLPQSPRRFSALDRQRPPP